MYTSFKCFVKYWIYFIHLLMNITFSMYCKATLNICKKYAFHMYTFDLCFIKNSITVLLKYNHLRKMSLLICTYLSKCMCAHIYNHNLIIIIIKFIYIHLC